MRKLLLAGLLVLVACSPLSSTDRFCDRFVQLVDDMNAGDVPTEAEFLERVAPDALGDPRGTIGDGYQRLLDEVARGDTFAAAETTGILFDACISVQANR